MIEDAIWRDCRNSPVDGRVGTRVIYMKQTSRKGWIGTIKNFDDRYVWIAYDNGTDQRYAISALEWYEPEEGYIMKLEDYNRGKSLGMEMTEFDETPRPTLKTAEYIVVVKSSNKVIPFFTVEDAEQFCSEQITTSHNMQAFAIFRYDFEMATKAPEVVRSVRKVSE